MRGMGMPTPRARGLGAALRDARVEKRFGVPELGRRIGVNPALLSEWEVGRQVPTPEEVAGVLGALGVTGERKAWIMSLARGLAGPSWFTPGTQADPTHYTTLVAHERVAVSMTVWAPLLIPDLVQIPDYARLALGPDLREGDDLEQVVQNRLDRNRILFGAGAIEADMFVGTETLANHFGDAEVMARQVRHLMDLIGVSQTLRIRVVPSQAVAEGAFSHYQLRDDTEAVYCPHHGVGVFLIDEQAAPYADISARLAKASWSPAKSLERLAAVADGFDGEVAQRRRMTDERLAELLSGEDSGG
ncbi:XRE family transcriptional regulator [Amycolatopsis panacis]|uniref:XRE family transcriptional regulator n=2 Tax=Amycolatopsis panacis TaxID=2340917 RepID=A0A419I367_9PSEU|nr:XRE family transcriptional regulator [Amycolatopsis panacis]